MEPKPFKPSINWAAAFHDSVLWTAKAWAISAVVVLVVLVLMRYFTVWGRQYWRITGAYFTGRRAVPVWLMFGVLLFSVIVAVRLNVLFSYQSNDLYTALQTAFEGIAVGNDKVKNSGIHGFWMSLAIFCLLASLFIARVVLDIYLTQRFIIAWRVWLTGHLTDDWLDGRAYYRDLFIDNTIDNPDQRIQQDVDIFTAGVGGTPNIPSNGTNSTLLLGAVHAVVSVISFTAILWKLSGHLNIFGFQLPRALFWIVLLYVLVATVVAFWLGRPLIWLSFRNEKLNAAFRYALVRLRDAAEAVGFYRGERVERLQLWQRFTPIIDNYRRFVRPHHRVQRMELVDDSDHRPAALDRAGTAVVRRGDPVRRCGPVGDRIRQHPRLAVVLPQQLRRVRGFPGGDHPVARAGGRQRAGPPIAEGGNRAHR